MMDNKNTLAVMLDCSRNAVMKVETVKKYADVISKMGYNALMLYTEDTYEIKGEPYFGYLRGRYSKEEIKELDGYLESKGIELIPCVQTLAHYSCLFKWDAYSNVHDTADILLVDEEKTYELLEKVISTAKECFSSNRINIGMDEAHMVGLGKYLDKHGYQDRFELFFRHLKKVCDLCEKYEFKPMMWSDMLFRLANKGSYYTTEDVVIPERILKLLPKNIELVYWDYYKINSKRVDNMLDIHKKFGKKIWYASGSWTWSGFVPHNRFSIDSTKVGATSCKKYKIKDVFTTVWGDDGAECSKFSVLPAVFFQAELVKKDDIDKVKFEEIVGVSYDDFLLLDLPDFITKECPHNPDKYGLYNDYFLGIFDGLEEIQDYCVIDKIKLSRQKLEKVDGKDYRYIFDCLVALCVVLEKKLCLGVMTRRAYKKGDREELNRLIVSYYEPLEKDIDNFYNLFKKCWFIENKPFGFEVHDARLGGLIQRTKSCAQRLRDFVDGKISKIEELEEEILSPTIYSQEYFAKNKYLDSITAGIT